MNVVRKTFAPTSKGSEIYTAIARSGTADDDEVTIIIDKSICFKMVPQDDPVCRYYRGRVGDIFRIRDTNAVNYRLVTKPMMIGVKGKSLAMEATPELYYKAHGTVIDMIADRQLPEDRDSTNALRLTEGSVRGIIEQAQYEALDINGVRSRYGQLIYVRFMDRNIKDLSAAGLVKEVKKECADVINYHNKNTGDELPLPESEDDPEMSKKIDIIVIYNNSKGTGVPDLKFPTDCVQVFSVQQLSFNITKYESQPQWTLLDPTKDRAEIRDQYRLNGRVIDPKDTLDKFNLKDGTKLVAI